MTDIFGKSLGDLCLIRNGAIVNDTLEMLSTSLLLSGALAYCIVVSLLVVAKVNRTVESQADLYWDKAYNLPGLRNMIRMTCLYPVTCFVSYLGANYATIYFFVHKRTSPALLVWSMWGYGSRGLLHLFAFLADPNVTHALGRVLSPRSVDSTRYMLEIFQKQTAGGRMAYDHFFLPATTDPLLRSSQVRNFQHFV